MARAVSSRSQNPGKIAVVDIGSNTVRLVVYDAPTRLPIPMFNEKTQCELGRGLAATGKLNPEGVQMAYDCLSRFINLSKAMGTKQLKLVATAAVRDAEDGPDFVKEVKNRFGLKIQVLSGSEEAILAAIGLLSGIPEADGLAGDLGGGSLDLVTVNQGDFGEQGTLPLGHLRMTEALDQVGFEHTEQRIHDHLAQLPWIKEAKGRTFYAIGGSWRALARLFIHQMNHPLHVVDQFRIRQLDALRLSRVIAGLSRDSLQGIEGMSQRRLATLPAAAMVMEAIIQIIQPEYIVFSGFGMREGQLLELLPEKFSEKDPLLDACKSFSERIGRFALRGKEILRWMDPLFPNENMAQRRLRFAACLLSDIGWNEHPDYRAEHAFHRVLRIPFAGLTHPNRVLLAETVYVRYNGDPSSDIVSPVRTLLDEDQQVWVNQVGLALRLAHTLSGSAPGLLKRVGVTIAEGNLVMKVPRGCGMFVSETVQRRMRTLANALGLEAVIV